MIAIGLGCRKGAEKGDVMAVVEKARALAGAADERIVLFTHERKSSEAGLIRAAQELGFPLRFLSAESMRDVEDRLVTRSEASLRALGTACVSEAAALAGAGAGGRLLVARIAAKGVTCAVARSATP